MEEERREEEENLLQADPGSRKKGKQIKGMVTVLQKSRNAGNWICRQFTQNGCQSTYISKKEFADLIRNIYEFPK